MENDSDDRIIYSLNVADIQTVAQQELGRKLSREEVRIVEDEVGDYINWYDIIHITMIDADIKCHTLEPEKSDKRE